MYIMNMEPFPDIKPRMFAVDYQLPSGSLEFTIVVLAVCPRHALEQVFVMFPELRGSCRQGNVYEVAYVQVDWHIGRTFVIKRARMRRPMLLLDIEVRKGPKKGGRNGGRD